jgi:hypothetical protein
VDQLYFELGYLEASYFTVIREAEAAFTVTASQSAAVDIADATGYYIPDYIVTDYFEAGGQVREADAAFTVTATQTATVTRITQAAATVAVTITKTCTVTRIIDSAAAFTAAFAPTLVAEGIKNSTAILDSVSSLLVDAVVNRSANVLLEHIADLNAMAAKTVDVNSNLSHTVSAVITANTNSSAQVTATSTATLACEALNLQFASAAFTVSTNLFVSRYTNGRPKHLSDINYASLSEYFTTDSKFGSHALQATAPTTIISATGSSAYSIIPQANQDWIFECWYYQASKNASHDVIGFFVGGGQRFFRLESEDTGRFTLRTFKTGITTTTTTSISFSTGWLHLVVLYKTGQCQLFVNGIRYIDQNLSAYTNVAWTGNSIEAQDLVYRLGVRNSVRLDDASFHRGSTLGYSLGTTITVPTQRRENDPVYTQFLYHFDNNGFDDIALTQTGTVNLSAVSAISAQANANTKLGAASLSTAATLSAQGDKPASATADLSTTSTVTVIIGSVKDSITLNAGVFTVIAQELRLRDAASSITSAFAPTLNAQATRRGDITMSTVFAMSTTATSFTDSTANMAAAFSITATANGIQRQGGSALSNQFNQTTTIGRLQTVSVPITSAFTTVMNVAYFEGTSLIAPMAAVMSVTAVKTARITKTLSVVASVSAVGNENPQAPPANPIFSTRQERIDVNVSYNYTYNRVSGTNRRSFNFRTDTSGVTAGSLFPNGSLSINSAEASVNFLVYEYGQSGQQDWYDSVTYSFNIGVVDSVNTGAATSVNGTGSIRIMLDVATANYLTVYLDGSPTPLTLPAPSVSTKSEATRDYYPGFQPFGIPNTNGMFGWPQTLFPSANSVVDLNTFGDITSSSATDEAYIPYYGPQKYGQADLIDINFATLTAEPFTVQFGQASAQVLTAISVDVRRLRQGVINLSSTVTTAINAGKNVEIASNVASQSTISVSAVKVTRAGADVNVVTVQSTANDRLRTSTVTLTSAVTASIAPVKRTGVVVNAESAVSQTATAFRIKQGQASISALYSQLSVAVQNATGTVLLETVTAMQVTAEKNAVGVIAFASQFTQSTDSADSKTVRVSSAIAAQATLTADGLRIQPAGANLSASVTQTTNTANSKITRVTAALATAVTTVVTAARTRSTPSTLSASATMVCNNVVLRQGNANLVDSFDILASPQYIIRITATFSAFNSQLTVGEIINIDPALQLMIEAETRINKIPQETRVLSIESETRVNIIEDKT